MSDVPLSCCDPFATWHGLPPAFVQTVLPKPAFFLFEYEEQLNQLNKALTDAGVCEHYAAQARIYLRKRCEPDLDCLAQMAEYLGWPPSYVEQVSNEGILDDILRPAKGPSS